MLQRLAVAAPLQEVTQLWVNPPGQSLFDLLEAL